MSCFSLLTSSSASRRFSSIRSNPCVMTRAGAYPCPRQAERPRLWVPNTFARFELQRAVAAGLLGAGPVLLGTAETCALLLDELQARVATGDEPEAVAREAARAVHQAGDRLPGFGHPLHRPVDPRAERILELADER